MSYDSNSTNRFLAIARSNPDLISSDDICTPFDSEMLGGIHENIQVEEFIGELQECYKIFVKPLADYCSEDCRKARRLLKKKKEQLGAPSGSGVNEENNLPKRIVKPGLKKLEAHSPFCTKARRRTSVVRKVIAEKNKAKALKAKEEREKRQHAALNRRQDMDVQGNKCLPIRPVDILPPPRVEPQPPIVLKKKVQSKILKTEKVKEVNGGLLERQKTNINLKKNSDPTKKATSAEKPNIVPKQVVKGFDNEKVKVKQEPTQKPIKGVLKRKSFGKTDHDKSVRFDETTTVTFDIEKLSLHDATNVIYNFDTKDIPSWALDGNLDALVANMIDKEDTYDFPFNPSKLIQY
uniref:Ig-like domain-containing protein n=1 Tax=Strongyloides stercoralis TaxID=6248 RepID=A0AAF5DD91_STRER